MNISRKIAFLTGLLLVVLAASAQAAQDYYDNGYRSGSYYGDPAYRNDRYGYGDRRVVRCESRESRTVYCGVDSRHGVRLVAQLSSSPCIEGRTWGIAREGLWVSRGCRAEFRVGDDRYGSNNGYDNRYRNDGYYGDRY